MGFQDCLYRLGIPYASAAAVKFADRSQEAVCFYAYWASTELAAERGRYFRSPDPCGIGRSCSQRRCAVARPIAAKDT